MGFKSTVLEDSVAQDNSFEGDHSLQPYPEVTLGATATATMLGNPHHRISLTEDLAIPMGSTPHHSRSASPKLFDINQMLVMMKQMMDQQSGMRNDMQTLKVGQEELKAGQQIFDVELAEVKGKMQNMDRRIVEEIRTVREEMNGVKENVEGVWTAMKTGKEEVTNKIMVVKRKVDKPGCGMMEITKGQGQNKSGDWEKHEGDTKFKTRPAGNKGGNWGP